MKFSFIETEKCKQHEYPTACFSFEIPADVDVETVETASLWLYKEPGKLQTFKNILHLTEITNHTR